MIVLSHYHQKFNTKQEETQVKLKATIRASLWYMAAMVTAIGALLVSSGIEHSANGWEMLGWAAVRTRKAGKATRHTKPRRTR